MKVIVVGGGIVGLSTAYFLGQMGVKSVLIERDSVGSHASGFAYGGISALGGTCNPGVLSPIAKEGMKIHLELANQLSQETGINTEFRYHPSLFLAFTEKEMSAGKTHANWVNNQDGYCANWLDAQETQRLEPRISKNILGSVHVEGSADVEPYKFSLALAHASERLGASIQHGNVIGLRKKAGRITGVILENGEISCDALVLAMGPWASWASDWLNLQIPVRPLKGQIIRLQTPGIALRYSVGWNGNYATSKPDGLVWAGTTEEEAGFNETVTPTGRDIIMRSLIKMLPSLSESQLTQQTACLRPVSSDGLPILGAIPDVKGAYIATGGARTGITLGPAMGIITAQLVTNGVSEIAIESLELDRFEN